MKKIFKTLLLLATVTASTGAIISCGDDDDLAKADALFRPIINSDDNIEMGLDENLSPYIIVNWDIQDVTLFYREWVEDMIYIHHNINHIKIRFRKFAVNMRNNAALQRFMATKKCLRNLPRPNPMNCQNLPTTN